MNRARSTFARSNPLMLALGILATLALCAACARPVPVTTAAVPGDTLAAEAATDSAGKEVAKNHDPNRADASEWKGQQFGRVEQMLAARFPGVYVRQTPQGFTVRLRGPTSFSGGNEPLYILDGFPIEPGPGGLIAINPADVESIEVLKDAASQAAYGLRGANGVIVIKTKRGN